ncbi:DUF4245 family protein [Nocardioides sp.]|uniref:DUF4245 family protein n=1 Tax=Nocardioides sp. TaxID=35761 RepID=UPI003517DDE9
MSSTQQQRPTGKPGRYQRSAVSLVTSLVVTILAVGAVLTFMGAFRNDYERRPDRVDYLDTVRTLQQAQQRPVYPASLPQGWTATGVDVPTPDDPGTMIRLLTDSGRFIGVRQEDASPLSLTRKWVDEDPETVEGYTVPASVATPVAREWKGWADSGGDSAYTAEIGGTSVIVFGSASRADLREVVDSLTTAPLG